MWLDSYRLCDSRELTEAKWLCKENSLRIDALTNKLRNSDPDSPDWAAASAALFEARERQKELVDTAWKIERKAFNAEQD